jgi:hypothetical protein
MLNSDDNRIYLKEEKKTINKTILAIIGMGILCINIYFRQINNVDNEKYLLVFIIVCLVIFIFRNLLTRNFYTIFIDTIKNEIVFQQGNKKNKVEIKIPYDKIKEINIVKYTKKFTIDIYDNELNAYECFDTDNYEDVLLTANEIEQILNIKIDDKTEEINYEGFKVRKI